MQRCIFMTQVGLGIYVRIYLCTYVLIAYSRTR